MMSQEQQITSHSCIRQSSIVAKCVLASHDAVSCPLADRAHRPNETRVGHSAESGARPTPSRGQFDHRGHKGVLAVMLTELPNHRKKWERLKSSPVLDFLVKLGSAAPEAVFTRSGSVFFVN